MKQIRCRITNGISGPSGNGAQLLQKAQSPSFSSRTRTVPGVSVSSSAQRPAGRKSFVLREPESREKVPHYAGFE
ncbi:MAG: hypothetical protein ACK5NE_02665 [Brachymonas sp.]